MTYLTTKLTSAQTIELQNASLPETIEDGHVRLKLATASLCGTDLHYFKHFSNAGFKLQNPVTLGHEACAYVVDANGSDLQTGQLVALNPIMNCGQCGACKRGEVNLCTAKKFPGSATTVPHLDGFFREQFDHPVAQCRPVAKEINPNHLTFAEPLACALHALNKGGVSKGDKVLITGCGPMGLLAIAGAAARGANVTCSDIRQEAADVGVKAGAQNALVVGQFDECDIDRQFDVVIEASGAIPAFNMALRAIRQKGTVSILSNIQLSKAEVALHLIMLKEIVVVGSFQFNQEFEEAVKLIESGKIDFDTLTAATYQLSNAADALELMASGGANGKILLQP
ncbi:alcohol dehydrogenase catalytic domain-containing protein [Ahrensia marina]|uniref:L-idonate 5-dehydrogenase n=1 Tax=Ahrensia marina TaxID=1514904 RepID=A0A0M9GLW7_9HYPH|nr:alcohol dehydrogenase catalytic domain-containing protein [Ahrensia marina]KPB00823.1 L-idonate 5-dehydrogenase [Ahrensia marina]